MTKSKPFLLHHLHFKNVILSSTHLPLKTGLNSAHANEYIDLHFRFRPKAAVSDDNISVGNKVRRLKMDPREYEWLRGDKKIETSVSHSPVYSLYKLMGTKWHQTKPLGEDMHASVISKINQHKIRIFFGSKSSVGIFHVRRKNAPHCQQNVWFILFKVSLSAHSVK